MAEKLYRKSKPGNDTPMARGVGIGEDLGLSSFPYVAVWEGRRFRPIATSARNLARKRDLGPGLGDLVCLNARSIINKKNKLNIMVDDTQPHIIGITELWENNDIKDAELGLEGYAMFRKDRMGSLK